MANYHLHTKPISRGAGRSAVAAAAYRRATVMKDERTDVTHYFDKKKGVAYSEMMFPDNAPEWTYAFREGNHEDSKQLWNMIERLEVRDDARLAREVEFSLPVELSKEQNIKLARDYIKESFVDRGMVADFSVHVDNPDNPHVHVMLTMRELTENGFGSKKKAVIDEETGEVKRGKRGEIVYERGDRWGSQSLLQEWRKEWAEKQNEYLLAFGHDITVDHRSYNERGIVLEPTMKLGQGGAGLLSKGQESRIGAEREAVRARNRDAIIRDPSRIIAIVVDQKATFTIADVDEALQRFIKPEAERMEAVRAAIDSNEVVELAETNDDFVFTTKAMLKTEKHMIDTAKALASSSRHVVKERHVERAIDGFNQKLLDATDGKATLSEEQISSIRHVTSEEQLSVVVGMAGAGKTTIMEAAKEAWEAQGYNVRGAALSGIAASNLAESGIASTTLHSMMFNSGNAARMIHEMEGKPLSIKQRDYLKEHLLGAKDIIVLDEAAMVGAKQMDSFLSLAKQSGSKVVLIGDHEQLQSIEAGASFRTILERLGKSELTEIRRQKVDWMREASQDFAKERTGRALDAYERHGHISHMRSYDVQPEPPKVANDTIWRDAGLSDADIERFHLVREYQSTHRHASMIVAAAKEADIPLQEHEEYTFYQFYADRRNEIAAGFVKDNVESYRILKHHRIDLEKLAAHSQIHDGVWAKDARKYAPEIVATAFNPDELKHSQRILSDDVIAGIEKGLGVPEIRFNDDAKAFLSHIADKAGLSKEEQAIYARAAEYHEMRIRAGEIWHEAQADKIELKEHEAFPEFQQVKARRDTLAQGIHDDIGAHYKYLRHFEIQMKDVAADYLVAEGSSRENAISNAVSHAKLFLNPDTLSPDQLALALETAKQLPKIAVASAMTHKQLVDDYMASYEVDRERSRIVLSYTRKDVAALNDAIRERMMEAGSVARDSHDVTLTMQDNDGEYLDIASFAAGDRIMFRSNDKELDVRNGTLGTITDVVDKEFYVTLDNGRNVSFNSDEYSRFQHGYAATVHKTQGVTVDESYVLASKHFDRHSTYVAMTRHKHDVKLYAASNQFRTLEKMKKVLSTSGVNSSTLDYTDRAKQRIDEKESRLGALWQRLSKAYHQHRLKKQARNTEFKKRTAEHLVEKQKTSVEQQRADAMKRVDRYIESRDDLRDTPTEARYSMGAVLMSHKLRDHSLPLSVRINSLRAASSLIADALDRSDAKLTQIDYDVEEVRNNVADFAKQTMPKAHLETVKKILKPLEEEIAEVRELSQSEEREEERGLEL